MPWSKPKKLKPTPLNKIAIIGGTGYAPDFLTDVKQKTVRTPHGKVKLKKGKYKSKEVYFLPRHGMEEYLPPHRINHHANIAALVKEGVDAIITTQAVGSLVKKMKPGDFGLLDDFIDFTNGRISSFHWETGDLFVDLTHPYSASINLYLAKVLKDLKYTLHKDLVYVCTQGPRFETRAEIRMFQKLGAHVVGMTAYPEVVLAKEVNIPYAALCIATNYACGVGQEEISSEEVFSVMEMRKRDISRVLKKVMDIL